MAVQPITTYATATTIPGRVGTGIPPQMPTAAATIIGPSRSPAGTRASRPSTSPTTAQPIPTRVPSVPTAVPAGTPAAGAPKTYAATGGVEAVISSTRVYCRVPTIRMSPPRSAATATSPLAPPAAIDRTPVTRSTAGCRASRKPEPKLITRVSTVTARTPAQSSASARNS